MSKSPFYVIEDFISQKTCDYLVQSSGITEPNEDPDGNPLLTAQPMDEHCETLLYNRLREVLPEIEKHFGFETRGVESMEFSWMPQDCGDGQEVRCGNAVYARQKWIKNKDRDFTVHLFLSSFNDARDDSFDPDYEVYGGKLQYPQYKFSFNPKVGTMIVHPAGPHFLHAYSPVVAGDLFYVTFHISGVLPHIYQPKDYPGDFRSWFSDIE